MAGSNRMTGFSDYSYIASSSSLDRNQMPFTSSSSYSTTYPPTAYRSQNGTQPYLSYGGYSSTSSVVSKSYVPSTSQTQVWGSSSSSTDRTSSFASYLSASIQDHSRAVVGSAIENRRTPAEMDVRRLEERLQQIKKDRDQLDREEREVRRQLATKRALLRDSDERPPKKHKPSERDGYHSSSSDTNSPLINPTSTTTTLALPNRAANTKTPVTWRPPGIPSATTRPITTSTVPQTVKQVSVQPQSQAPKAANNAAVGGNRYDLRKTAASPKGTVQFTSLPLLYELPLVSLVPPSAYDNEARLKFGFTETQLDEIFDKSSPKDMRKKVMLRCSEIKPVEKYQSDLLYSDAVIRVNNSTFPLQKLAGKKSNSDNTEPVAITSPLDITPLCKLDGSSNELAIMWPKGTSKRHGVGLFLGKCLAAEAAVKRLESNPTSVRKQQFGLDLVKKKYDMTAEFCVEPIKLSLLCPITKKRIKIACVGSVCDHLSCFDGRSFLEMSRGKSSWTCPICSKKIGFNDLLCDKLCQEILTKAPQTCNKVEFDRTGRWTPVLDKEPLDAKPSKASTKSKVPDIIEILDSSEEEDPEPAKSKTVQTNVSRRGQGVTARSHNLQETDSDGTDTLSFRGLAKVGSGKKHVLGATETSSSSSSSAGVGRQETGQVQKRPEPQGQATNSYRNMTSLEDLFESEEEYGF